VATRRSGLPDPQASRAVLVGVSDYMTLEQLPAVANNIATLQHVITDTDLWGLPDEHCTTLLNPTSVDEVLDAVHGAASAASDVLLFYFAGHGLLDDRSDLHLALPGSDSDRLYKAVRYDDIRREVVGTARACYGKVVILDCCYSGRALQGGMSGSVEVADHASVDGTYLMTASAETSVALAPPGEDYTGFTGALVDKLVHGLPDGPELLDMETLFHHIRADMKARLFPIPQARTRNDGKAIALVRNRRGTGRRTAAHLAKVTVRVLPEPPTGLEALLRHRPGDMYAEVQALRANGQEGAAEQVLVASAALRADQEVAAIVDLLRCQGTATDLRTVILAAAQRPPDEVLRIVDALRDTDLPGEATGLVRAVGAGPVGDVASLAHLLHVGRRAEELVELLDAALDTAQAQSSLIDLVNALWMAGLREDVDGLIDRAVSKLPGPAIVDVADELRAVGREEAAFGLYAASAETVARRPKEAVAQLCHAMTQIGRAEDSARVAQALINSAADVASLRAVATAFWDTDQERYADQCLTRAATVLSNSDIIALAAELRVCDHDQAAYQLCLRAMPTRSAAAIQEIIAALREEGRPVDARKLFEEVVGQVPVDTVFELLGMCGESDRHRVLRKVTEREPSEVAALLDKLAVTHPAVARQLTDLITATATTRVGLLAISVEHLAPQVKEQMFASIIRTTDSEDVADLLPKLPDDDARFLMFLVVQAGNPMLASIIDAMPTATSSTGDPVLHYLLDQPIARFTALIHGLCATHFETYAQAVLTKAAAPERGARAIAKDVAFLFGTGEASTGRLLLGTALHGRSNTDLTNMITALREQDQPEVLKSAAEWIKETYARIGSSNVDGILRQIGLNEYATRVNWLKRRRKND
jgi:Caspase domain